ncbi:MAG: hypothetical protein AAFU41_00770 [Pseudomonadota bacterium]
MAKRPLQSALRKMAVDMIHSWIKTRPNELIENLEAEHGLKLDQSKNTGQWKAAMLGLTASANTNKVDAVQNWASKARRSFF